MAKALGQEFEHIKKQLVAIHWVWRNYRQLFATSKEHFDLLNARLPGFALLCHTVFVDAVILGICRLADNSNRQRNLTFAHLRSILKSSADQTQLAWLDVEIEKIQTAVKPLRKHRHKRIAHLQIGHALNASTVLPPVSRQTIEDALKLMRDVLQGISDWTDNVEFDFDPLSVGDADSLISCVQQANRLCELQDDYHFRRLEDRNLIEKLADRQLR